MGSDAVPNDLSVVPNADFEHKARDIWYNVRMKNTIACIFAAGAAGGRLCGGRACHGR